MDNQIQLVVNVPNKFSTPLKPNGLPNLFGRIKSLCLAKQITNSSTYYAVSKRMSTIIDKQNIESGKSSKELNKVTADFNHIEHISCDFLEETHATK